MKLIIGFIYGGPESRSHPTCRELDSLDTLCEQDQPANVLPVVNVVYCIHGSLVKPDWEGVRSSSFFAKEGVMMVQAAVPPDLMREDVSKSEIWDYFRTSVLEATQIASRKFEKKKIPHDPKAILALLERVDQLRNSMQ